MDVVDQQGGSSAGGTERFRLAIVGGGRMGRMHLSAISGSDQIEIVGVVEPAPGTRAVVQEAGGTAFASLDDLLAATGVDGALIAVPTDRHVDVVGQVLGRGIPALCEKPCGLTVEETIQCAGIAEQAGLPLRVAYWRRFVPALIALRRQITGGELGAVLAVNCYQWDFAPPSLGFRASSGGIFADMGVHEFDQVRWLTGREFASVQVAKALAGAVDGDPDCAQLVAELDDGCTALVSLGRWYSVGDTCRVEAFGTKGAASSRFLDPLGVGADGGEAVQHRALQAQAEDFAKLVRAAAASAGGNGTGGEEGSCATIADAIAAQRVVDLAKTARE